MKHKKTLSALLALVMVMALAVPTLAAESDFTIEAGVLTRYNGPGGDVTIPDGVTEIGWNSFRGCASLTSVTIPDSVTKIEYGAFNDCIGLTSMTISNSVTEIGDYAVQNCTGLTSVTHPNSVTKIGYAAFSGCTGLTSVTLGTGVTTIGESAFDYCDSLTDVYFAGAKTQWDAITINQYGNDPLKNATIHYNSTMSEAPKPTAAPSPQTVLVDGKKTDFAMYALNNGAVNYIRARDLAIILSGTAAQFNVGYDETSDTVILTGKTAYQGTTDKAPFTTDMVYTNYTAPTYVDGKAVNLEAIQIEYNGGGYTYYKLRDLGQALGFNVGYDNATDTVYIETNKPYDPNN